MLQLSGTEASRELIEATVHLQKLLQDVANLNQRLLNFEITIAATQTMLSSIKEHHEEIKESMEKMQEEVDNMHEMATRWKGGIAVVLALGGVVGYILSFVSDIWKYHS